MTKPLSPAAQAVLDACDQTFDQCGTTAQGLAAALRAAADQVAPSQQNYDEASHEFETVCLNGMAYAANELRAIAAELEGADG